MDLTYTVRGSDGGEYGPATLADLTTWISEGRVTQDQQVRRSDMQHWAAASAFAELQTAFTPMRAAIAAGTSRPVGTGTAYATTPATISAADRPQGGDPATIGQMKSGGSWFYWVAGLSLVNTISAMSGSDWRFILGLGITQVFDAFGASLGGSGKMVALVLDLMAAGTFIFFGVFANKGHQWAFIAGMVLFALDGVIFLIAQHWIGVGFHVFVLYCLFRGFSACRELRQRG